MKIGSAFWAVKKEAGDAQKARRLRAKARCGAADKFEAAAAEYRSGLVYGAEKPEEAPLVYALVTKDGVERY